MPINPSVPTTAQTIVLVDPTAPDGETSLQAIDQDAEHVSVVVLLTGRHSNALREFALAEDLDLSGAGWQYLEQVNERIQRPGLVVELVAATGPNTADELVAVARDRKPTRIVLPASVARSERKVADRIRDLTSVPVVVADLATIG